MKPVFFSHVLKMRSVFVSRTGGSLQGLSGLSPSVRSECQHTPVGPRELVWVVPFMLN